MSDPHFSEVGDLDLRSCGGRFRAILGVQAADCDKPYRPCAAAIGSLVVAEILRRIGELSEIRYPLGYHPVT